MRTTIKLVRDELEEIRKTLQFIITSIMDEEEEHRLEALGLKETIKRRIYPIGSQSKGKAYYMYIPIRFLRALGINLDEPKIYVDMTLDRIHERIIIKKPKRK